MPAHVTKIEDLMPRALAIVIREFPDASPGQHLELAKRFSEDWISRVMTIIDLPTSDQTIADNVKALGLMDMAKLTVPSVNDVALHLVETTNATSAVERLAAHRQATAMTPDERVALMAKVSKVQEKSEGEAKA